MIFCPKCGTQIKENVSFCPNCGEALKKQLQLSPSGINQGISTGIEVSSKQAMLTTDLFRSLKAGVYGVLFSLSVNLFSPIYVYFLPSFLAVILVMYLFRVGTLKDGLITAYTTYIASDSILSTLGLALLFSENGSYVWGGTIWDVFLPIVNLLSALIAAYVGVLIVRKRKSVKTIEG